MGCNCLFMRIGDYTILDKDKDIVPEIVIHDIIHLLTQKFEITDYE